VATAERSPYPRWGEPLPPPNGGALPPFPPVIIEELLDEDELLDDELEEELLEDELDLLLELFPDELELNPLMILLELEDELGDEILERLLKLGLLLELIDDDDEIIDELDGLDEDGERLDENGDLLLDGNDIELASLSSELRDDCMTIAIVEGGCDLLDGIIGRISMALLLEELGPLRPPAPLVGTNVFTPDCNCGMPALGNPIAQFPLPRTPEPLLPLYDIVGIL